MISPRRSRFRPVTRRSRPQAGAFRPVSGTAITPRHRRARPARPLHPPRPEVPTAAKLGRSSSSKTTGSAQLPRLPFSRSAQVRSKLRCCDFHCSPSAQPVLDTPRSAPACAISTPSTVVTLRLRPRCRRRQPGPSWPSWPTNRPSWLSQRRGHDFSPSNRRCSS